MDYWQSVRESLEWFRLHAQDSGEVTRAEEGLISLDVLKARQEAVPPATRSAVDAVEQAAWQRMRQADYIMELAIDVLKEEDAKSRRIKELEERVRGLEYHLVCARGRGWLRRDK